jgi:hypothetical protein
MLQMLVLTGAGDQDVVQITESEVQTRQHLVNEGLKGLPSIMQPKWHPQELPEAKGGDDCCLVDIHLLYRYLVITFAQVQLTEDGAAM